MPLPKIILENFATCYESKCYKTVYNYELLAVWLYSDYVW